MRKNRINFPRRLFVSGTDTGVGKTLICAILMAGMRGIYWKPIQSGLDDMTDTEWVRDKTGLSINHFHPETYRFTLPISPHASAALDGVEIDLEAFKSPEIGESGNLIIEGAGGLKVPLNEQYFMIDLIKRLDSPVLLVSPSSLGTINHTLLSLEVLRREGLDVMGVVMNGPRNSINCEAIEHYGRTRILAEIDHIPMIDPKSLAQSFEKHFSKP
ncbi:dethiobiotin synthase [Deltaproteobacteria bacterium]|nr:dethiobiotin synthase [Deltaproteobacteria bacterium]